MAATTGIHDGKAVLKNILAGASAVQIVTTLYKNGPEIIGEMLNEMEKWMTSRKFNTLKEITGKLNLSNVKDPVLYERSQFMRYFSNAQI